MEYTTIDKAELAKEYIIKDIITDDEELNDFLFTLGCYKGEKIVLVSIISNNYVVSVKDSRYNINDELAKAIIV